jgi:hypothetical protein
MEIEPIPTVLEPSNYYSLLDREQDNEHQHWCVTFGLHSFNSIKTSVNTSISGRLQQFNSTDVSSIYIDPLKFLLGCIFYQRPA